MKQQRRSRSFGWRFVLVICLIFVIIPPTLAFGWTRYRYAQGTYYFTPAVFERTSGFLDRVYNKAFREHGCGSGVWEVHYRKEPGTSDDITWLVESGCSPTEQGQTIGPRKAYCIQRTHPFYSPGAYNCDTTVP
jgi:hypothetical protein